MTKIPPRPQLPEETPDLYTQLEDILDMVWKAEADWRFDDRIRLSLGLDQSPPGQPEVSPPPPDPDPSAPPLV